ncbi:MAG: hypothetical protein NTZ93_00455 [Candidatus Beckwithbacteria bacterium]|nr:hypothetical protein [Candidatus Beckwithbacteria bacterium]
MLDKGDRTPKEYASVQAQIQKQKNALEARLLEHPLDNFKTFYFIALDLGFADEEELIQYLQNKKVLDVGSGFNGLAIGSILKGVSTDIISVTPRKRDPNFQVYMRKLLESEDEYRVYSREEKDKAIKESMQKTYFMFAHDLSFFKDESFDVVIDNAASFYYARNDEVLLLRQGLREELRVLRQGGTIRVGDFNTYGYNPPSWREGVLIDEGVNYSVFKNPHTSGVEITKI